MKTWTTQSGTTIIQVLAGRSNAFLITRGKNCIMVDTGPGFMWNTLSKRLELLHIRQIDLLVLTHSHFDHAANASRLKEQFGAQVIIHQSETEYLTTGDNILPSGTNRLSRLLVRTFAGRFRSAARYAPCSCDKATGDFFDLDAYGFNGYLVHTPGHTKGSISAIFDDEIALVGDTMFGIFPGSVFPPFASDPDQLVDSWGILLKTKCRIFIPAHGSANTRDLVEKDYRRRMEIRRTFDPQHNPHNGQQN